MAKLSMHDLETLAGPEAVAKCDRDEMIAFIVSFVIVTVAAIVLTIGHFAFGWTI